MLTDAQKVVLTQAIAAEPSLVDAVMYGKDPLIKEWLDGIKAPAFYVYKTSLLTEEIFNAITWANLTPQDVPDGAAIWTNRSLACQGKQFNLQTILTGRETINPSKPNIRAGLQDALTGLPSGANGVNKSAGWTAVAAILYRPATNAEALLATGTGTTASPALMNWEGTVTLEEVGGLR